MCSLPRTSRLFSNSKKSIIIEVELDEISTFLTAEKVANGQISPYARAAIVGAAVGGKLEAEVTRAFKE